MERKLTAILAADAVGYSRLTEVDEPGTHVRLMTFIHEIFEPKIAEHHGRVVKRTGDGLLAEFPSVVEAVQCGVEVERASATRNEGVPEDRRIDFRIGINLGDVIVDGGDIYGEGVNVAARIESLAEPGGICITGAVLNQIKNKCEIAVEDLGKCHVKNISEPIPVFRVLIDATVVRRRERWSSSRRRLAIAAGLAATILVSVLWAGAWYLYPRAKPPEVGGQPMIAVLPFQNLSAEPGQDYFSDGLTNDLTTDLTRIKNLKVLAANTAFTYKDKPTDARMIHRDLGVRYILEGSVQRDASRIRVNAQLIDAAAGTHLWAARYDRNNTDIFAVQDEILSVIMQMLALEITEAERERIMAKQTTNAEADRLWKEGRAIFTNGTTREENRKAQALFDAALKEDENFSRPRADLAHTYVKEWRHNWWDVSEQDSLNKALTYAVRAVQDGPDDEYAHVTMAIVRLVRGEYDEAIAEYEQATALSGGHPDPDTTAEIGFAYIYMNREAEGIAKLEEVRKANPVHPWWYESCLAWAYYQNKQYSEAVRVIGELKEDVNDVRMILAASYARLGEMEKAKETMAKFLQNETWTIADEAGAPFVDPEDEKHWLDGLRMAGMPEGSDKTPQP